MAEAMDCTFLTERGKFNFRVGVIISSGAKILMARNPIFSDLFFRMNAIIRSAAVCISARAWRKLCFVRSGRRRDLTVR